MATYALLGATGATGSAILQVLLETPPTHLSKLNILVRSKTKLLTTFPALEEGGKLPFSIALFESSLSDQATLQSCLEGASVVYQCIATNQSTRGVSVCHDTVSSIIVALQALQERTGREAGGTSYTRPTILQLRSVNCNEVLASDPTWLLRHFVRFCLYYVYADIEAGCTLLARTAEESPALLEYIFVDPPGLMDAYGTTRTGHKLLLDVSPEPTLMYADLGAAYCEIAERKGEFGGKAVIVSATGKVNSTALTLVGYVLTGLRARLLG